MAHLRILALIALACAVPSGPARAGEATVAPQVLAPVPAVIAPSALPADWVHGAFAEIYVRGYADSNGDGIGDLKGLTGRLDYLHALGVTGLWLMPVTRSGDRDHGYAVEDYRDIEPGFGTLADFDELVAQAHARGIGIVVDYVINHSASSHPLFLAAAADRASPYRDWYLWRDAAPTGWKIFDKDPWNSTATGAYFSQFSVGMPDWNLREPAVMAWHMDNLRFWLNRGVDGFRFDAVAHLVENGKEATRDQPESLGLMRALVRTVHAYPNRYVVCEATREEMRWAGAEGCGGAFAIWMAPNFAKAAKGDVAAVKTLSDYFASAPAGMASMASNHDLFAGERLWDQVGGERKAYMLAAASYLLAPATPFVYYGEEVGMSAAPALQGDARLRIPMSWSADAKGFGAGTPWRPLAGNIATQNAAAEGARADSLLHWYQRVIALRKAVPALARGRYEGARAQGLTWSSRRVLDGQVALVLVNYGEQAATMPLDGLEAGRRFRREFPDAKGRMRADAQGSAQVLVPPRSIAVYVSGAAR
jgi:glycosidase